MPRVKTFRNIFCVKDRFIIPCTLIVEEDRAVILLKSEVRDILSELKASLSARELSIILKKERKVVVERPLRFTYHAVRSTRFRESLIEEKTNLYEVVITSVRGGSEVRLIVPQAHLTRLKNALGRLAQ